MRHSHLHCTAVQSKYVIIRHNKNVPTTVLKFVAYIIFATFPVKCRFARSVFVFLGFLCLRTAASGDETLESKKSARLSQIA